MEWKLIVVDSYGGGHDSLAVRGYAVEARSWDFGDQSVPLELPRFDGHLNTAS